MQSIKVNITIYGKLAKIGGGKHIAILDLEMPPSSTLGNILEKLRIPMDETSYIFLNAVLCDVPGLSVVHDESLKEGAHIGIFSTGYMWPYQYRDGMPMSDPLVKAMKRYGAMHHSYKGIEDNSEET